MKFQIWSCLFYLSALCACGPSPQIGVSDGVRRDPSPRQIEAARQGVLTCQFKNECEPAVTMVSVATPEGVSRCTGILISDRKVLTNDHCLESMDPKESQCDHRIFFHFDGDVHRSCKKILLRSGQRGIDTQDYAVLELSEPVKDRRPLRISRRGFQNHEWSTLYRVQTTVDGDQLNGIQTKTRCQATYRSLLNVNVESAQDPIMTFGDCAIQAGHSGSPLLNQNGEVGAIVQGKLFPANEVWQNELKPFLLDSGFGEVAVASQTRCMTEISGMQRNQCNAPKPFVALFPKDYLKQFGTFQVSTLPWISTELSWFKLKNAKEFDQEFVSVPRCISRIEARMSKFSFTAMVMSYQQGINSRLQSEWRAKTLPWEKETLFKLITEGAGGANFRPAVLQFESDAYGRIELPVCL